MSELSPEGGSEGYGGCDDDVKSLDESVDGMMSVMAGLGSQVQRPAQFFLGTVLAGSQEGLKVACNGLELDREDIWINETLKRDYTYQVSLDGRTGRFFQLSGTLSGPVTCPAPGCAPKLGSVTGGGLDSQEASMDKQDLKRLEFALKKGDIVVMLTEDLQTYYLICKVVAL